MLFKQLAQRTIYLQKQSMFKISIRLIKQLRDITGFSQNIIHFICLGSPINECKKALEGSNGNLEQAQITLKERGLLQAQKKESNITKEGVIGVLVNNDNTFAVAAEINCETDFVARTEDFLSFSQKFLSSFLNDQKEQICETSEQVNVYLRSLGQRHHNLEEERKLLISRLQENIVLSKLTTVRASPNGVLGVYQHNCYGSYPCGLSGSILELRADNPIEQVDRQILVEAASNLAISYLGLKPQWMRRKNIPNNILEQEKEKIKNDIPADKKKNEKTLEFIIQGRLKKFYEDKVFEDMEYVLNSEDDEELTIGKYLQSIEKLMKRKTKISIERALSFVLK